VTLLFLKRKISIFYLKRATKMFAISGKNSTIDDESIANKIKNLRIDPEKIGKR
jgi:hypothetical protein